MNSTSSRREFLKQTSIATAAMATLGAAPAIRADSSSPNEKVQVAVIGCNNRGMNHIDGYLALPNAEIAYVCDVDSRVVEKGIAAVAKKQARKPKGATDLRKVLEDPKVDAVSIATPDHWHAPATILACAAGKHVYVEKPGSHNFNESEMIVAAARKYKRVVQMGNQRRSWPWVIEAIEALKAGAIGKATFARCWYTNHRPSIGAGKEVPVPAWLDYSLWEGPALEKPYKDNILHYNWHWFWNYGTGELGNNGVHSLDLARWGLDLDLPQRVTCGGNRYHYPTEWETPDTMVATFDFGDKGVVWEGQSCDPRGFEGATFGINFYGEKGCMALAGNACTIYDLKDKVVREIKRQQEGLFYYDSVHFGNFLDGIREGKPLRADIAEGQKSTLLCHLGNIAWRSGQTVQFDPKTKKVLNDAAATAYCKREYRPGWEPKV